jgi:hypothetical protein
MFSFNSEFKNNMKETRELRLKRLRARRDELYDQRKKVRDNPGRNVEHKLAMMDQEIKAVEDKVTELKEAA